jgi:hypothetical protein
MTDRITANLPSRDMNATAAFYEALGFTTDFNDGGWMIIRRGALELEFFHMPDLNPKESWFSACIRVDDLDALYADFLKAGLTDDCRSMPRIGKIDTEPHGIRLFCIVDPEGSLLRCIDNRSTV